jgi:predicted ABC-type sugar transport system permease subunit
VETITVAAERIPTSYTLGMPVFIGIALVIVVVAWMVLSKRHRQPPRA